jgi:hypothetical protein
MWKPLFTAPHEPEKQVLLAKFRDGETQPEYMVSARWVTIMPGHTDFASYSGWFLDPVTWLDKPNKPTTICIADNFVPKSGEYAPTHWWDGELTEK